MVLLVTRHKLLKPLMAICVCIESVFHILSCVAFSHLREVPWILLRFVHLERLRHLFLEGTVFDIVEQPSA